MSRKIFDKNLFLEGMRQNRVQGFLYLFLLTLYSVMYPIWEYLSTSASSPRNVDIRVMTLMTINPALMMVMFLFGALLMAHVFRFLHQRNSSDFYHAIPQTRLCLYVSFFASAIAWMTILLAVPAIVGSVLFAVQRAYFRVQISEILRTFFHLWVGSLYIMSIVAVALSLTGTMFSCVIVSCMICFLPRLYVWVVENIVAGSLPMVPASTNLIPHFALGLNIPLGYALSFSYLFTGGMGAAEYNALSSWQSLVYTGTLTVILILLGAVLFQKRKSESAAQASANRFLQGVFRFLAAFTASLLPLGMLFEVTEAGEKFSALDREEIFWIVLLYILVLVVYFVYELITTRKWKNLVRIIPGILFIFAADAAVFLGMAGLQKAHASFEPTAEEIESVSFKDMRNYYSRNYFSVSQNQLELQSEPARKLVSEGLSRVLESVRKYGYLNNTSIENMPHYETVEVSIRSGGQLYSRYIFLTYEEMETLTSEMGKIQGLVDVYQKLPEKPVYVTIYGLTEEKAMDVYRTMAKEMAELPFEKAYGLVNNFADMSVFPEVQFAEEINGQVYVGRVPFSLELTPDACEKYIQYMYRKENVDACLELVKEMDIPIKGSKELYGELNVLLPDGSTEHYNISDYRDYLQSENGRMDTDVQDPEVDDAFSWKALMKENLYKPLRTEHVKYLLEKYQDTAPDLSQAIVVINLYHSEHVMVDGELLSEGNDNIDTAYLFADPAEFVD